MDELEFRRRLLAQPHDKDKALLEYAQQSPERLALVNELKSFDKELQQAMQVPVPESLADKIILRQSMSDDGSDVCVPMPRSVKRPWYLALAASIAIVFSVALYQLNSPTLTIGEHALAHVYHEIDSLESQDRLDMATVNARLSELGGQLSALPGEVTYARFCRFKGQKSLHLVFESDFGPMTVFIVPTNNEYLGDNYFSDQRFAGRVSHFPQGDAILVAAAKAPIDEYQSRINQSLHWL
ncbi:DUF3379 family protein [Pseudoalteromonas sp. T1lg75]|uniref:DUF3379 family protein n=1 Tax=Pseudoalteromonas sp. T1lg75 TaxID=2077102 RepID=UPI001319FC79|nr:DUF3379 family protein [Pseudoalteromonas sp. T1lg75]